MANWSEVAPLLPGDRDKHPELFYYSGLFRLKSFADLARAAVEAKNRFLPLSTKAYVNYSPPLSEQLTWDRRGHDPFLCHRNGAFEMGWTEDWLGYGASPQQMSTMYAQLRAAGAPERQPLGGYMVAGSGGARLLRIKYYEMIAAGVRCVDVYNYGPHYASCDSWSTSTDILTVLRDVQFELGAIDEALHGTVRHKTDVAILYNRTAGIWMYQTSAFEQDSRFIQWTLAHAGYDADFIPEEDIEAGKLAEYKVLYLNGPQIRPQAADKIAAWVKAGGVLVGSAGAGSRDTFDRPLATLTPVFGAESADLKLERDAGRPKYELRSQPTLAIAATVAGTAAPSVRMRQLCARETLQPLTGAVTILAFTNGAPAGVFNHCGKGAAIRLATLPGIAYLHEAIRDMSYDADTYSPTNYPPAVRDFIAWPAAMTGAFRTAQASSPIAEVVRYDGPNRAVLFVIDHRMRSDVDFRMTVAEAAQFNMARTARGAVVRMRRTKDGALELAFPLDQADAVVLEKRSLWNRMFAR